SIAISNFVDDDEIYVLALCLALMQVNFLIMMTKTNMLAMTKLT
ncbi:11446_t:CDS:1, partial [Diversispora eburnea]